MDEQPAQPSGAARTTEQPLPPGKYRWDGQTFRPAPLVGSGMAIAVIVALGLGALIGVGLGQVACDAAVLQYAAAAGIPAEPLASGPGPPPGRVRGRPDEESPCQPPGPLRDQLGTGGDHSSRLAPA
jgi:hypothetical protein